MKNREAQKRLELLQLIKTFASDEHINGQFSLLDEIEKTKNLYTYLDRDWTIIAKQIQEAVIIYFNQQRYTQEDVTTICKTLLSWCVILVAIAKHQDYINSKRIIYEQLLASMPYVEKQNSDFTKQEKIVQQIQVYKKIYYSKISLLDEIEREKELFTFLDSEWNFNLEEILQVQEILIMNQKYVKKDMVKVCQMTTNFYSLISSIAQFCDFIKEQRISYDCIFEFLKEKNN